MLNQDFAFIIAIGALFVIFVIVYLVRKYLKILPTVWATLKLVFDYFYLVLIPIPVFYLIYYFLFFNKDKQETYIFNSAELIFDLKNLSYWFFTAGVFSASSKLLSNLVIFKKQFNKVIMSKEFDDLLGRKLEVLTFSHDSLSKQSNLDEIWKRVTLCKYEKSFPYLMQKLNKNLENELFEENNLSAYYKNLRLQVKFELLENDIIKITEVSNCTVVTNSDNRTEIKFFLRSNSQDEKNIFTKIEPTQTKIDGVAFDLEKFENIQAVRDGDSFVKTYNHTLQGKTEYNIERYIVMQQKLSVDRIYSFSSSKIIDGMHINLQYCSKLQVEFSSVGKNNFTDDNIKLDGICLTNRDVLMPGEKFKVFVFKD